MKRCRSPTLDQRACEPPGGPFVCSRPLLHNAKLVQGCGRMRGFGGSVILTRARYARDLCDHPYQTNVEEGVDSPVLFLAEE